MWWVGGGLLGGTHHEPRGREGSATSLFSLGPQQQTPGPDPWTMAMGHEGWVRYAPPFPSSPWAPDRPRHDADPAAVLPRELLPHDLDRRQQRLQRPRHPPAVGAQSIRRENRGSSTLDLERRIVLLNRFGKYVPTFLKLKIFIFSPSEWRISSEWHIKTVANKETLLYRGSGSSLQTDNCLKR